MWKIIDSIRRNSWLNNTKNTRCNNLKNSIEIYQYLKSNFKYLNNEEVIKLLILIQIDNVYSKLEIRFSSEEKVFGIMKDSRVVWDNIVSKHVTDDIEKIVLIILQKTMTIIDIVYNYNNDKRLISGISEKDIDIVDCIKSAKKTDIDILNSKYSLKLDKTYIKTTLLPLSKNVFND